MLAHQYVHKEYICHCDPNFQIGDQEDENHKDPRNEWTGFAFRQLDGICPYCNEKMKENPRSGEMEIIKNSRKGSWQSN